MIKAAPDQRIPEKRIVVEPKAKPETVTVEATSVPEVNESVEEKPKEEAQKAAPRKRFSREGFRSMNSIEEVIKEEVKKSGGEAELIEGDDLPNTPFGQEQLDKIWKTYVQTHLNKANRNLFTTLNSRSPELKPDFQLYFPIENHVQLNQIDMIKVDLVNYLRKHLNNYSLSLLTPVKKLESKKHVYTDEEVYKSLAEKYPLLEKLRKGLDLDLNH